MYRKYNKQLDIFLSDITQNYTTFDRDAKIKAIQYKIEFLSNKTLMYISEYVNDMFYRRVKKIQINKRYTYVETNIYKNKFKSIYF